MTQLYEYYIYSEQFVILPSPALNDFPDGYSSYGAPYTILSSVVSFSVDGGWLYRDATLQSVEILDPTAVPPDGPLVQYVYNGAVLDTIYSSFALEGPSYNGSDPAGTVLYSNTGSNPPPSTLTVTPGSQAISINLSENTSGTITTSPQTGTITFTDTDTTTNPYVSNETFTVTATDSHGNTVDLTAAQISLLETGFSYNLPSTNSNNGSINWTYSLQGLNYNFLTSNETVVVTPTITVADQDGNSQTASVAITLSGPTQFLAGFDTAYYPGATSMQWLKNNTNLQWVDYYLTPAPSQSHDLGWMGTRATLQAQGWLLEPIYVGRQSGLDPSQSGNSLIENQITPTNSATQQGHTDGMSAVAFMKSEGFGAGTTVYLDIESGPDPNTNKSYVAEDQALQAYISGWCSEVVADGYSAGIYCRASAASTISQLDPGAKLMIANTLNGPTLTANIDETSSGGYVFPEASPAGSNVAKASSWQYAQGFDLVNPINSSVTGLNTALLNDVDLDVMTLTPRLYIASNDFTGSGTSDILLQNGGNLTDWLMNKGSVSSSTAITTGLPGTWNVVGTGDFTGSGTADILLQNGGNLTDWVINNGSLASSNTIVTGLPAGWNVVGTGDFNGDGTSDILLKNGGSLTDFLINNNALLGSDTITTGLPAGWNVVGTGDFTGDGTTDILLQNGSSVTDWLMNDGLLLSSNAITTGLPAGWKVVGTGDFNGDGTSDILLQNGGSVVDWLMSNGSLSSSQTITTGLPAGWNVVGTGDYNGDGTSDILLQNGGSVTDWLINNGSLSSSNSITTNLPPGWNALHV
jgi:hypothetical protein